MKSFREWKESQPTSQVVGGWKASKDEIINHWKELPPSTPISQMRAVPTSHKGPTYSFDGLRITGSSQWIDFVLSRLKNILSYETEKGGQTRLQVIYKQIIDNKTQQPVPESFAFYIQVKQRENKGIQIEKPHKIPKIKSI